MWKKTIIMITAFAAAALTIAGCHSGQSTGQQKENNQQAGTTNSLIINQPLPHFNWSQYRQTVIDAETIAANGTQTTSFFFNQGVADPIFSCPSLGVPVPNTAQLSNPQQVATSDSQGNRFTGGATIGQMDPYGAYTPSSSSGTFVVCVGSSGKPYLQYWEGFVQAMTVPARWDNVMHKLVVTGAPTVAAGTRQP